MENILNNNTKIAGNSKKIIWVVVSVILVILVGCSIYYFTIWSESTFFGPLSKKLPNTLSDEERFKINQTLSTISEVKTVTDKERALINKNLQKILMPSALSQTEREVINETMNQ